MKCYGPAVEAQVLDQGSEGGNGDRPASEALCHATLDLYYHRGIGTKSEVGEILFHCLPCLVHMISLSRPFLQPTKYPIFPLI